MTLVNTIIPRKRIPAPAEILPTKKEKQEDLIRDVAISCIRIVLDYLIRGEKYNDSSDTFKSSVPMHLIDSLEEEEWVTHIPAFKQRPKYHSSFRHLQDDVAREDKKIQGMNKLALSSLCEVFSDFLLCSNYIEENITSMDTQEQISVLRVLHSVNILFDSRRKLILHRRRETKIQSLPSVSSKACANYIYLSAFFFHDCVHQGHAFGKMKQIEYIMMAVPTVIDLCKILLGKDYDERDIETNQNLIHSLWLFYQKICSEKGCRLLMEFLQMHSSLQQTSLEPRQMRKVSKSLMTTESRSKIEIFIRTLRSTILSCFHSSLLDLMNRDEAWYLQRDSSGGECIIVFCIGVISALCRDICSGVLEQSGVMTKALFQMNISMIKTYVKAILEIPLNSFANGVLGVNNAKVQEMCLISSKNLWNALCSIEINHTPLFKTSLECCLLYLPQMNKRLERLNLSSRIMVPNEPLKAMTEAGNECLIATALDQSFRKLIRLHMTTGLGHQIEAKDDFWKSNAILSAEKSSKMNGEVKVKGVASLDFTLVCSFLVVEQLLVDSYQIIHDKDVHIIQNDANSFKALNIAFKDHAVRRKFEVGSILKGIALFLSPLSRSCDNNCASETAIEMITESIPAYLLSDDGKHRLCSTLDQIVLTLRESLLLTSYLFTKKIDDHSILLDDYVAVLESIVHIVAWCSLYQDDMHLKPFVEGARHWYKLESQASRLSGGDVSHYKRIFKTLNRIEELERSLQEFHLSLLREESFCHQMDEFILLLVVDSFKEDGLSESTLCHVIGRYIHITNNKRKFESSEYVITFNKNPPKKECHFKKRKNASNGLIDNWLELDKGAVGRKGNKERDQFDDLVDFLVEG